MFDLKNYFLFAGLSDNEKAGIINALPPPESFKKGETIFSPESFRNALGILCDGKAVSKGSDIIRREFSAGDTFGAAALFGEIGSYATDITAKSDCRVIFIEQSRLEKLFESHPETAMNYIAFLSEKVRFLNKKISLFSANGTAEKLYLYLCENNGKKLNFSAVSNTVGIGRTSLYRSLAELEENGMIKKEKNIVRVISK